MKRVNHLEAVPSDREMLQALMIPNLSLAFDAHRGGDNPLAYALALEEGPCPTLQDAWDRIKGMHSRLKVIDVLEGELGLKFRNHITNGVGNPIPRLPKPFEEFHWVACVFHETTDKPMIMRYDHDNKSWSYALPGEKPHQYHSIAERSRAHFSKKIEREADSHRYPSPGERLQQAPLLFFTVPESAPATQRKIKHDPLRIA
ncbi:MAG: hypothetical protein H6868_00255 [Rhodospirillales bacterium]|nr:hypothetical protein [Rhodospirillales bacterium]